MKYSNSDLKRFWSHVDVPDDKNDCWEWKASTFHYGHGQFHLNGTGVVASRFSYELHFGQDPGDLFVCHKCDNPKCVNPTHLFLDDHDGNMKDMVQKGRSAHPVGSLHPQSVLTESNVKKMLNDIWSGKYKTIKDILSDYSVTYRAVKNILKGTSWTHVTSQSAISLDKIAAKVIKKINRSTNNGLPKLNKNDVIQIRKLIETESKISIAKKYNVSSTTIYDIINGKRWKHVK